MRYLHILLLLILSTMALTSDARHTMLYKSRHMVLDTDTIIRKQSLSVGVSYGSDAMFLAVPGQLLIPLRQSM
ncbi:hypothetical protein [Mucilaginibacter antarcticus]|uniref:hypothetical protein n=1 Tax=Mucilaginibacter antarcticus TaxID=1855725 RepID=UPI003643E701